MIAHHYIMEQEKQPERRHKERRNRMEEVKIKRYKGSLL